MEVTVRLIDGEPTVGVQVLWKGAELNLNRAREEPVERFQQRLGLNCGKQLDKQGGGAPKRAKKDKRKPGTEPGDAGVPSHDSLGIPIRLLDSQGEKIPNDRPVAEALRAAAHVEIQGERLPVVVNPPSISKLEVFGQLLSGCPVVSSLRSEFCKSSAIRLRWLLQATAGADPSGQCIGEGPALVVPEDIVGQALTLRADAAAADENVSHRPMKVARLGPVEEAPQGWPEQRCAAYGTRQGSAVRVVCWNLLAAVYSRSQVATKDMYPYCPPSFLDFGYRQPLIGRELVRLAGDLVFLQECSYSTFSKFLTPIFGDRYHLRISLKASKASEGCVLLVRKDAFEVLEETEGLFRNLFLSMPACAAMVREVAGKWPDFLQGILPHMTTVFQVSAVRRAASGEVLVLANTHLFFHPNARHIRLLQVMCLLLLVQEYREKHRPAEGAPLPRVVLSGDLNSDTGTAPVQLLLDGKIASYHPDWEHASIFTWRESDELLGDSGDEGEAAPEPPVDAEGQRVEPMPREQWQPGMGLSLTSPVGPLATVYAAAPLPFTNYVHGFNATLDWILVSPGFAVEKTLAGASEEDLAPNGGLPCVLYPSDHLSIAADLQISTPSAAPS